MGMKLCAAGSPAFALRKAVRKARCMACFLSFRATKKAATDMSERKMKPPMQEPIITDKETLDTGVAAMRAVAEDAVACNTRNQRDG